MAQCDLCGRNEALTKSYTVYSARSAGSFATSEMVQNRPVAVTTKSYKEFITHEFLVCKRCRLPAYIMATIGILIIVSIITLAVLVGLNPKSISAAQFFSGAGIALLVVNCVGVVSHFVVHDKRLKRKAIRSRGSRVDFRAWTEREFKHAFGDQRPI